MYLDNIVIWSQSLEEHVENVTMILDVLKKAQIILQSKNKPSYSAPESDSLDTVSPLKILKLRREKPIGY